MGSTASSSVRTSDDLVRDFYAIRKQRDRLKAERDSLLCERHELGVPDDWDWDKGGIRARAGDPCWKSARRWERDRDGEPTRRFYFDPPPAEWCAACRRRQNASDAYRATVKRHGGALRGLLRRGKALSVGAVDPHVADPGKLATRA